MSPAKQLRPIHLARRLVGVFVGAWAIVTLTVTAFSFFWQLPPKYIAATTLHFDVILAACDLLASQAGFFVIAAAFVGSLVTFGFGSGRLHSGRTKLVVCIAVFAPAVAAVYFLNGYLLAPANESFIERVNRVKTDAVVRALIPASRPEDIQKTPREMNNPELVTLLREPPQSLTNTEHRAALFYYHYVRLMLPCLVLCVGILGLTLASDSGAEKLTIEWSIVVGLAATGLSFLTADVHESLLNLVQTEDLDPVLAGWITVPVVLALAGFVRTLRDRNRNAAPEESHPDTSSLSAVFLVASLAGLSVYGLMTGFSSAAAVVAIAAVIVYRVLLGGPIAARTRGGRRRLVAIVAVVVLLLAGALMVRQRGDTEGGRSLATGLEAALRDANPDVRKTALDVLAYAPALDAIDSRDVAVHLRNPDTRAHALRALEALGSRAAEASSVVESFVAHSRLTCDALRILAGADRLTIEHIKAHIQVVVTSTPIEPCSLATYKAIVGVVRGSSEILNGLDTERLREYPISRAVALHALRAVGGVLTVEDIRQLNDIRKARDESQSLAVLIALGLDAGQFSGEFLDKEILGVSDTWERVAVAFKLRPFEAASSAQEWSYSWLDWGKAVARVLEPIERDALRSQLLTDLPALTQCAIADALVRSGNVDLVELEAMRQLVRQRKDGCGLTMLGKIATPQDRDLLIEAIGSDLCGAMTALARFSPQEAAAAWQTKGYSGSIQLCLSGALALGSWSRPFFEDSLSGIRPSSFGPDFLSALMASAPHPAKFVLKIVEPTYFERAGVAQARAAAYLASAGDPRIVEALRWIAHPFQTPSVEAQGGESALIALRFAWESSDPRTELRQDIADKAVGILMRAELTGLGRDLSGWWSRTLSDVRHASADAVTRRLNPSEGDPWWSLLRYSGILAAVLGTVAAGGWLALVIAYPHYEVARRVLSSPTIRKIPGIKYLDVAVTIPFVARRLLAPYRSALVADASLDTLTSERYFPGAQVRTTNGNLVPLRNAIHDIRGVVLLTGGSGLGKTMFLRDLILRQGTLDLFVYLRAADCTRGIPAAIAQKLVGVMADEDLIQSALQSGVLVLCIDGLNEAPPPTRERIWQTLRTSHIRAVVTTQPLIGDDVVNVSRWELCPLSIEMAKQFLKTRVTVGDELSTGDDYGAMCDAFFAEQERQATLDAAYEYRLNWREGVLGNPLDLSTVAHLLSRGVSPDLVHLYRQQVELMESDYQRVMNGATFPLTTFAEYVFQQKEADRDTLAEQGYALEMEVMERHKLVVQRFSSNPADRTWVFRHDRLRDYFVALAMARDVDRVRKHMGETRFRQAIVMLAWVASGPSALAVQERLSIYAAEHSDIETWAAYTRAFHLRKESELAKVPQTSPPDESLPVSATP